MSYFLDEPKKNEKKNSQNETKYDHLINWLIYLNFVSLTNGLKFDTLMV